MIRTNDFLVNRHRWKVSKYLLILLFLWGCANQNTSSEKEGYENTDTYSSLQSQIDKIIEPYLSAADFMGVVAVQRDGETPLILPYGFASVELHVPHSKESIFNIGSVSKQFTAAAILLLEEDGAIRTDERVSRHLPSFHVGEQITIEQLLTHNSGIADIYSLKRFGDTAGQGASFKDIIDDLGQMELTNAPGASYAYSNGGYAVLAAIIEKSSGATFGKFLERRIFEPLGMTSTSHDSPGPAVANRVTGYDPWGRSELTPVKLISASFSTGSGSIWSSADDLLAWNSALHNGKFLSAESYKKLVKNYGHNYGYGVSLFQRFGRRVIGHDGRITGYASDIARYTEDRVSIVILSNVQSVARDAIRKLVAAAIFGEPYSIPPKRVFIERPQISSEELSGVYSFGPALKVSITEKEGRLLARANEGGYSELIAMSETEWFSRTLYATIRFGRDESGKVDRIFWGRGERAPVGRRLR